MPNDDSSAMAVTLHRRIFERHPQLSEDDVRTAWNHAFYEAVRTGVPNPPEFLRIGIDGKGRMVEMVGVLLVDGRWLVYHANTPVSRRVRAEIEKGVRRR